MTDDAPLPPGDRDAYLAFFHAAAALKDTLRSGFTPGGRPESTAEHTWRLCLIAVALDEVEEVLGDGYDLHRLRPPSYEAGPASLQAPTGGRYSTPCGTPSPTEVKRTRKPYSESRGFRQVVYTTKGRFRCA